MANSTKTAVNYSEAQTLELVSAYTENPTSETVEAFAVKFGKSVKSVVAKLSREGVYKKKEYVSKTGEKPQAKESYADSIGAVLGLSENDTSSLAKANKVALKAIFEAIKDAKLAYNQAI